MEEEEEWLKEEKKEEGKKKHWQRLAHPLPQWMYVCILCSAFIPLLGDQACYHPHPNNILYRLIYVGALCILYIHKYIYLYIYIHTYIHHTKGSESERINEIIWISNAIKLRFVPPHFYSFVKSTYPSYTLSFLIHNLLSRQPPALLFLCPSI